MRGLLVGLLSLALVVAACESEGGGGAGDTTGGGPRCGTVEAPTTLELAGVTPAPGSTVENRDIVQAFTVVDPPGLFNEMQFMTATGHTAGAASTARLQITIDVMAEGGHRYTVAPVSWATAPGHVELVVTTPFEGPDGCIWAFPTPLFSYDLVPAGTGPDADAGGADAEPDAGTAQDTVADGGIPL